MQVFIACGVAKPDGQAEDPFRKPKPGMWHLMEQHFNSGITVDKDQLFYFSPFVCFVSLIIIKSTGKHKYHFHCFLGCKFDFVNWYIMIDNSKGWKDWL